LKHLPAEVLAVSPRASAASLVINENEYMDEDRDIVKQAT